MNPLKKRLDEDRPCLGFLLSMPSVGMAQVLAASGADWVMVDLEHGPIDLASAHAMIAATAGTGCTPLARVPSTEPWLAKPLLDAGAFGLIFPMICTRAEAEASVRAIRYPPEGERGWGPFYAPARWGVSRDDYMTQANDELLNIILIEHVNALPHLDDILAVKGIDVAVIAPFDLSVSLGAPGQRDHPDVVGAITVAEEKILAAGITLGGLALGAEEANAKIERGYRLLVLGYDVALLEGAAATALAGINR
jgi:4-hydroxy-2-oxoheptanedioate aldolase